MLQTFDNFVLNVILSTDILSHMIQKITKKKKAKCTFLHKKQMYLSFVFYPCFIVSLILKKNLLFIYKLYSNIYLHQSSYIARRYIFSRYFFQHYASIWFAKQLVKLSSSWLFRCFLISHNCMLHALTIWDMIIRDWKS